MPIATIVCPLNTATLIYNPIAGRNRRNRERQVREAAAILEKRGIGAKLAPTTGPDSARELARSLAERGEDFILVCGGDGTINEVINGIVPGRATLGILPGGTANVFARELGIPSNPVRAAQEMSSWSPRRIALGRSTWSQEGNARPAQRFFLSLAGIGFDAYVVHRLSWNSKLNWGVVAYVAEAIRQSMRYKYPLFVCQSDGCALPATFATVQRTKRYAGWLHLAPLADLFQPNFCLCAFRNPGFLRYLRYAVAVVTRRHSRLADVSVVPAQKIVCVPQTTERPIYFELDGELVGVLPATFEIVPDALTVLVPSKKLDSRR